MWEHLEVELENGKTENRRGAEEISCIRWNIGAVDLCLKRNFNRSNGGWGGLETRLTATWSLAAFGTQHRL